MISHIYHGNGIYGLNIHQCRQLQMSRYSNEMQHKLQTIPHTIIEAVKERILANTLPPKSKLSQDLEVYRVTSTTVSFLFFFCIQLICSSHSHSYTINTCYTLSSFRRLWPINPNPAIMQPSGHIPLQYMAHHAEATVHSHITSKPFACSGSPTKHLSSTC